MCFERNFIVLDKYKHQNEGKIQVLVLVVFIP